MNNVKRSWVTGLGVAAGSVALVVAGTGAASAHVSVATESAAAGSTALLAFSMSHGCDGSATTRVTIKVPAGINTVAPTINPGWTVTKVIKKLATPVQDQHGAQLTERVDQVVYQAKTPLADGYRDVLTISVPLPEDSAGKTLAFPVIQTCEKGETAWVDLAADGQDAGDLDEDDLQAPAPTSTVTAAEESEDHHASAAGAPAHAEAAAHSEEGAATALTTEGQPSGIGVGLAGLVAGLAGLALGAFALVRGRTSAK